MAIPTYDKLTLPLSDGDMTYNKEKHRYVLDLDYAVYETGLADLIEEISIDGTNDNALWLMDLVSHVCYEYIRSFKDSRFDKRLTYYLSHSKSMRNAIKKLMVDTLVYTNQEGGLFTAYVTGINLQEAKNITTMQLETVVSMVGKQIVLNYGLGEREFRYDFDVDMDNYEVTW